MMAATHLFFGELLGTLVGVVVPEYLTVVTVAGGMGGVFPDLDMVFDHRKTLHFPVYYWVAGALCGGAATIYTSPGTVFAAVFFLGAATHSVADIFSCGRTSQPWRTLDDRGVYLHPYRTWVSPRRWVRYNGSPEDLLLATVSTVPVLLLHDGGIVYVTAAGIILAFTYALFQNELDEWAPLRFQ